jgi:hypothetical protein
MIDTTNILGNSNINYGEQIFIRFILPLMVLIFFYIFFTRRKQKKEHLIEDLNKLKECIDNKKYNNISIYPTIRKITKRKLKKKKLDIKIKKMMESNTIIEINNLYGEIKPLLNELK